MSSCALSEIRTKTRKHNNSAHVEGVEDRVGCLHAVDGVGPLKVAENGLRKQFLEFWVDSSLLSIQHFAEHGFDRTSRRIIFGEALLFVGVFHLLES